VIEKEKEIKNLKRFLMEEAGFDKEEVDWYLNKKMSENDGVIKNTLQKLKNLKDGNNVSIALKELVTHKNKRQIWGSMLDKMNKMRAKGGTMGDMDYAFNKWRRQIKSDKEALQNMKKKDIVKICVDQAFELEKQE